MSATEPQINYADLIHLAKEGSPLLLNSVGRLVGLGQAEQKQLVSKGIPGWAWGVLAVGLGVVVGVRAHKSMPDKLPKWITGK